MFFSQDRVAFSQKVPFSKKSSVGTKGSFDVIFVDKVTTLTFTASKNVPVKVFSKESSTSRQRNAFKAVKGRFSKWSVFLGKRHSFR